MVRFKVDFLPKVRSLIHRQWQCEWDIEIDNKVHLVKPILGKWHSYSQETRRIEVILCRLRIGHTRVMHRFYMCGDDPSQSCHYGEAVTVLHILCVCPSLDKLRRKHFSPFYRNHIPLHPALLLGQESLISYEILDRFLTSLQKQICCIFFRSLK